MKDADTELLLGSIVKALEVHNKIIGNINSTVEVLLECIHVLDARMNTLEKESIDSAIKPGTMLQ